MDNNTADNNDIDGDKATRQSNSSQEIGLAGLGGGGQEKAAQPEVVLESVCHRINLVVVIPIEFLCRMC